jgi:sulfoxide reductase heme-binding subunit YedZ
MKISRGQIFAAIFCLIPFGLIAFNYARNELTANPIQAATLRTGHTAINLLVLSLACTPIRNLFGLTSFLKIRKTLGLFSFFYATLHFLVFIILDFELNLPWILEEILGKPFIQIGLAALILLIPLTLTSIPKIQRKMGKSWETLHKLVYLAALLVILHYLLATKGVISRPIIYAGITLFLLLLRIFPFNKIKVAQNSPVLTSINTYLLRHGLA